MDGDGVTWKDLPKMEDIEKAYCEPGNDTSSTDPLSAAMAVLRVLSFRRCMNEETDTSLAYEIIIEHEMVVQAFWG